MIRLGFSVVICCYTSDRLGDLYAAISSVRRQTLPSDEIIVVVDHNDDLFRTLRDRLDNVVVVETAGPRGLSSSRDRGVAAASGDIIAFLDDDAVASATWLERLNHLYQDRNVIGAGGAIKPLWASGRPSTFPPEFDWIVGCTYLGMPETTSPVRNLIGCNMSFRREVFEPVGGFRVGVGRIGAVPVGGEETDFCIRARRWRPDAVILYDPDAVVYHRVPALRSTWRYFRSRCFAEGRSKALLTHLLGSGDSLESEKAYTRKVLPRGVIRGLGDAILRRDLPGFGRSIAITMGLTITMLGYVAGSVSQRPLGSRIARGELRQRFETHYE